MVVEVKVKLVVGDCEGETETIWLDDLVRDVLGLIVLVRLEECDCEDVPAPDRVELDVDEESCVPLIERLRENDNVGDTVEDLLADAEGN